MSQQLEAKSALLEMESQSVDLLRREFFPEAFSGFYKYLQKDIKGSVDNTNMAAISRKVRALSKRCIEESG